MDGVLVNTSGLRALGTLMAVASALLLAGCAPFGVAGGPVTSEDRDIGAVTTVVLQTSGDVTVSPGEPALSIHAPRDALEWLTSDVNGDTLTLGVKPGIMFGIGTVQYELTLPDLQSVTVDGSGDVVATVATDGAVRIDLHGSGDIEWTGLATENAEVAITGSGDVTVSGATDEFSASVAGSGNVHAVDLAAQRVEVVVNGSGDVDVSPVVSLSVRISGSGAVTYSGDPTLDSEIAGSGDVTRR